MNTAQEKIKILLLITKGNFGGAQRYVFDLASNIPKDRFDIVIAFGEGELLEKKLKQKGERTIRLKNSRRDIVFIKDLKLFFEILKLFKQERPRIVHLNSSKIGLVGILASYTYNFLQTKNHKLKTVFTAHGWAFNENRPRWQKSIIKVVQWLTVIMSDKTIAVSEKTKRDFTGWVIPRGRMEIIYNGIEQQEFIERKSAREKLLPEKTESFWVGTISELHRNKGLDILIKAVSLVIKNNPNVIVTIIGEGEDKESLQNLIEKEALKNSVFLLGQIENGGSYLKAFDVFTLTSRTEGLPYVLLEAGMAGLPVVASNVGGIPEIITEGCGLLFRKEDISDLREKLENLINNHEKMETFGLNLKNTLDKNFSLQKMVNKTVLLYNGLV